MIVQLHLGYVAYHNYYTRYKKTQHTWIEKMFYETLPWHWALWILLVKSVSKGFIMLGWPIY